MVVKPHVPETATFAELQAAIKLIEDNLYTVEQAAKKIDKRTPNAYQLFKRVQNECEESGDDAVMVSIHNKKYVTSHAINRYVADELGKAEALKQAAKS